MEQKKRIYVNNEQVEPHQAGEETLRSIELFVEG